MDLSVVVPVLNDREALVRTLDGLRTHAPETEVVVVNGPSVDGTTGMVRDRTDVEVLVEIDDRSINVARNAGIRRTSGEAVALVAPGLVIGPEWPEAVREALTDAAAVTGPTRRRLRAGHTAASPTVETVFDDEVTLLDGGNAAISRAALSVVDGFDERLAVGGAADLSARLAAIGDDPVWEPSMSVSRDVAADGGDGPLARSHPRDPEDAVERSLRCHGYRLGKSYGPRPGCLLDVLHRTVTVARTTTPPKHLSMAVPTAASDSASEAVHDDAAATADGRRMRAVMLGLRGLVAAGRGLVTGTAARLRSDGPAAVANPAGLSAREDRAVAVHDRR